MHQVELFNSKCQLSTLRNITTKSNDMSHICRPYQMNISGLRLANKGSSGKKKDLMDYLLKSL